MNLELVTEDSPEVRALSTVCGKELAAMIGRVAKRSPSVAPAYQALVIELLAAKRAEEAGEAAEEVAACGG